MYIFLAILIVIACVLLIGVVLIQKSKGGGLASDYSGGNQYLGYRKTTDFVEKATWSLAIFVCVISIFASFAIRSNTFTHSAIAPAQQAAPAPKTEATPAATPAAQTSTPEAAAPEAATPAADAKSAPEGDNKEAATAAEPQPEPEAKEAK